MINRFLDLAIQIQQIPAPSFEENERAQFIRQMFVSEALTDIQTDSAGNVLARLKGKEPGAPLIISAHMDTVFPAETDLAIRRAEDRIYGPGIGDNSMGVAGLFGVLWILRERGNQLPGDVWFVANTCEEGLGDLRGMKALVEHFGAAARAYLILEGMALGHVYHKAIGVRRYKITVHAPGGHSWIDYGRPSAIHELAELITKIAALKLPENPRTTLNVGRMGGGTTINTIAAEAWLELDLRSEGQMALVELDRKVENLVETAGQRGVRVEMELIGQRPAGEIPFDHPIILLAESCLRKQGFDPVLTIGSTDANIPLSKGYPAVVLGLTHGGGAHTLNEFVETGPVARGLEQLADFVERVWG